MSPIDTLIQTVKTLRGPNGCPWDIKQTFKSLMPYMIEEAYELCEALEDGNKEQIKDELGDVLLQVVMLSNIAAEENSFTFDDVANNINAKMIRRHPHVFSDTKVTGVDDVISNWERIKQEEKQTDSIMDSIPKLPSLMKAEKIQKKAAKLGFDWPDNKGAIDKLKEEVEELSEALHSREETAIEEEAGDILFSVVNCLRKANINPEMALQQANNKFIKRFKAMEAKSDRFESLSLEAKEALWNEVKDH